MKKITGTECVEALRREFKNGTTAKELGEHLGTDARAVATALRAAVADGRVQITGWRNIATYKAAPMACAVRGSPQPGAMCGKVLVGGQGCGFGGQCEHKKAE